MHVKFYKSSLCPRCYLAKKNLLKLTKENPDIQIEEIDFLTSHKRAKDDGITMIPAIKIGNRKLSGLVLGHDKIDHFIQTCLKETK